MAFSKQELATIGELISKAEFKITGESARIISNILNRLAEEYQLLEAATNKVEEAKEKPNVSIGSDGRGGEKPKSD